MSERKSIYSLSIKEMRKLLRDFSNTLYGRTVFFLAYFVPMTTDYLRKVRDQSLRQFAD